MQILDQVILRLPCCCSKFSSPPALSSVIAASGSAALTQVEQSYKILHSSYIYLARQIGRYLTRILQIARKCTQNEAFLARSGYILARSCTNLAIAACKNRVLNGRHARINGSCKVLQDSLQENPTWKFLHANVSFLQDL